MLLSLVRNMTVGENKHLKTGTELGSMPARVQFIYSGFAGLTRNSRKVEQGSRLSQLAGSDLAVWSCGRIRRIFGRLGRFGHTASVQASSGLYKLDFCQF
jgi:hypothetical protein